MGQPGDKYEQEADATAAKVVKQINSPGSNESVQTKVEPVAKPTVMRHGGVGGGGIDSGVEQSIQGARGSGQGLSGKIKEPMERAFGADFSGVKVHTDGNANQLNRSLHSRAFATGQDIFFKGGEYNPGSSEGQELIAHELTHVVQQNGSVVQQKSEQSGTEGYLQAQADESDAQSETSPVEYAVDETTGQRYVVEYRVKAGRQPGTFVFVDTYNVDRGLLFENHVYSLEEFRYPVAPPHIFQYVRRASSGQIEHFPMGESYRLYIGDELLSPTHSDNSSESEESILTSQERSGVEELLSRMKGISRDPALFIAGAFYQWLRNNGESGRWVLEAVSLGTSNVSEDLEILEESLPKSGPFEAGKTAGDLAALVTGILEVLAGGGAIKGGGSLCLTGVGCIAGAPAIAAGGVLLGHGGSVVVEATENLAEDLVGLVQGVFTISSGGTGANSGGTPPPWRGTPRLEDGTTRWGWIHIEGRHITGTIPGSTTDLFPPGTTRAQIEEAIQVVVNKGTRTSNPQQTLQIFEKRIKVNGRRDRIRVVIDTGNNGRVVTAFPVRSE